MNKKKILIHSLVFSPDSVSTAYIYKDIALGFKKAGYEVIVLTSTPHYNIIKSSILNQPLKRKLFGVFFESNFNGIKVIHIPLKKYKNTSLRVASFIYWHFLSLIFGLCIKKIDFVLSPSPPLSIGFISILIAKKNKAKFVYNVQEVYPDLLIRAGKLKSKILINLLKLSEKYIYDNASAVVVIDEIFYNQIIERFENKKKLFVVPNFVDTELYKPYLNKYKFPKMFEYNSNKIRFLYAGNIGLYQDWDPILYAANKLMNTCIEFWIIGEGVKKQYLVNQVNKQCLKNIKILPYQDRELMPMINSFADVHFISNSPELDQDGFPSKVYTIMACAKPMIVITGYTSPLYNFLKNLNCSILITENRNEKFLQSIIDLVNNKDKMKELAQNGREIILNNYTKEKIISKYLELFQKL